jgi:hypothetical protein
MLLKNRHIPRCPFAARAAADRHRANKTASRQVASHSIRPVSLTTDLADFCSSDIGSHHLCEMIAYAVMLSIAMRHTAR